MDNESQRLAWLEAGAVLRRFKRGVHQRRKLWCEEYRDKIDRRKEELVTRANREEGFYLLDLLEELSGDIQSQSVEWGVIRAAFDELVDEGVLFSMSHL